MSTTGCTKTSGQKSKPKPKPSAQPAGNLRTGHWDGEWVPRLVQSLPKEQVYTGVAHEIPSAETLTRCGGITNWLNEAAKPTMVTSGVALLYPHGVTPGDDFYREHVEEVVTSEGFLSRVYAKADMVRVQPTLQADEFIVDETLPLKVPKTSQTFKQRIAAADKHHEEVKQRYPDVDDWMADNVKMAKKATHYLTSIKMPACYNQSHSQPVFRSPFASLNKQLPKTALLINIAAVLFWFCPEMEEVAWNYLPAVPGITSCWLYISSLLTGTGFHCEDLGLPSVNFNLGPSDKLWFVIDKAYAQAYMELCNEMRCAHPYIWKNIYASLELLRDRGIKYVMYRQKPGMLMWLEPFTFHMVINCGKSFALARNVFTPSYVVRWADFGKRLFELCADVPDFDATPNPLLENPHTWSQSTAHYAIGKVVLRVRETDVAEIQKMDEAAIAVWKSVKGKKKRDSWEWEKAEGFGFLLEKPPVSKGEAFPLYDIKDWKSLDAAELPYYISCYRPANLQCFADAGKTAETVNRPAYNCSKCKSRQKVTCRNCGKKYCNTASHKRHLPQCAAEGPQKKRHKD